MPEPTSTGDSAIVNSSIRPAFTYSRIVAPPPAMRTSRSPAASRACSSASCMPSLTKWQGGPARPLPGVTLLVRHDEDRRVERRLLRPRLLAEVEHALAHHARAGALERLAHDVVLAPFLAALAELQVLLEETLRVYPLLQFHPLRHPPLPIRVVHGVLGRDEPVQRHAHAEEHRPGHQSSPPWRASSVT